MKELVQSRAHFKLQARRGTYNPFLFLAIDAAVSVALLCIASYAVWSDWTLWAQAPVVYQAVPTLAAVMAGKWFLLRREFRRATDRVAVACVWVLVVYAALATAIVLIRPYYSRSFLVVSFGLLMAWQFAEAFPKKGMRPLRLAAVPMGIVDKLIGVPDFHLAILSEPTVDLTVDGIVVDLHHPLPAEWARFVADSAACGIPIYHAASVYEVATARVSLEYANAGWLGQLFSDSAGYLPLKRVIDVLVVLLSVPVVVPLSLLIALLIRLDTQGPVLFWQERVGQGGKVFRIVKFRSMRVGAESNGAQFADVDDSRITRVGRVLRKYRLDELPQLWNVLKGEMSLIGPRPEQVEFARQFEREIPFYNWRHRVKPGITGWAQVQQGYAAGVEDTMEKLEYDLYYVKHLSFWLDLNIAVRTIGTILTGRGAR